MTNVSDKPMKGDIRDKIEDQFAEFLGSLSDEQARTFYQSFFTESEQIMFVKRLAIITLPEKSAPYSHIAKILKVSPSTVKRIDGRRQDGEVAGLIDLSKSQGLRDRLWTALKILIDENVHHYGASGWRWLDRTDQALNQ